VKSGTRWLRRTPTVEEPASSEEWNQMVEENSTSGGASLDSLDNWEKIKSWVGFWVEGVLIPILCIFGILGKLFKLESCPFLTF
jgi:hypothetical protein